MIIKVKGDLFKSNCPILVNAVNCIGIMGGGIAYAFAKKFPNMFADYKNYCRSGLLSVGKIHVWKDTKNVIINAATMFSPGSESKLSDIKSLSKEIKNYCLTDKRNIAIPAIGCGIGGLEWNSVKAILIDDLQDLPQDVMLFDPW